METKDLKPTISKKQFTNLKGGDLVLWRGKYLRTVLSGPGDSPVGHFKSAVDFPIRRRSWTNRARTVYLWNDVKDKIRFIKKRTRLPILPSEAAVLKGNKFDPRMELRRELREAKELAQRMGRPLCSGFTRLSNLTTQTIP